METPSSAGVIRAILFDLDGTLVDTSALDALRTQRKWRECVAALDRSLLFPGVRELLTGLEALGINWAVVTTSVSHYARRILLHHQLRPETLVAYHDAPRPKPSPLPTLEAMRRLGVMDEVIGCGDTSADFGSFSGAGVPSYCAAWNPRADTSLGWGILRDPLELLKLVRSPQQNIGQDGGGL